MMEAILIGNNACACKGIRRCLLCEDPHSHRSENAITSAKVVVCFIEMSTRRVYRFA